MQMRIIMRTRTGDQTKKWATPGNEVVLVGSPGGSLVALGLLLLTASASVIAAGPILAASAGAEEPSTAAVDLHELDLLSQFGIAPLDSLPPVPSVSDYLGYAAAHNQELMSAYLVWRAIAERVPQATALPDPRFNYTEQIVSVETRVGPQQRSFALFQTIPWFGKLSLKGQVEAERAAAVEAQLYAVLLKIAFQVRKAYYDLAYLGHSIAITAEHLDLLTQWEEVARSRYATGAGGYADVIKAQVELGKLSDRLAELRDRYRPLAAALNAVLDRPADATVPWPGEIAAGGVPLDEAELLRRMSVENPELSSLRHQADRFRQAEKLAGKQRYPDLTLGLSYIQTGAARMDGVSDSGKDPVLATLSLNIPLWGGKYSAAEREAAGNYLAISSTRNDKENSLTAALEGTLFAYRDALRKMDLYGDTLLPKGRQSLGATMAAYETGTAGFLDVVDAERLLLEFELSHARAAADLMINSAKIEMLVGGPVATGENN